MRLLVTSKQRWTLELLLFWGKNCSKFHREYKLPPKFFKKTQKSLTVGKFLALSSVNLSIFAIG